MSALACKRGQKYKPKNFKTTEIATEISKNFKTTEIKKKEF
jgi:hypothetical protein